MKSRLGYDVGAAFRARSLRSTPQRYAVFQYLLDNPVHATAEEIFRAVNRSDPRSSRATVYNSLHALVRAGLVREVALEGRSARFDANLDGHHHFLCERCGAVEDVDGVAFTLPELEGRTVRTCDIVFHGLCGRCHLEAETPHA
ncbi:MAG TPA: Fur family transcriptional regulator [Bryobacteraceae bacterium]|nr:Fur family transcriptional regulator [Bryobacteraceae bacterium]